MAFKQVFNKSNIYKRLCTLDILKVMCIKKTIFKAIVNRFVSTFRFPLQTPHLVNIKESTKVQITQKIVKEKGNSY